MSETTETSITIICILGACLFALVFGFLFVGLFKRESSEERLMQVLDKYRKIDPDTVDKATIESFQKETVSCFDSLEEYYSTVTHFLNNYIYEINRIEDKLREYCRINEIRHPERFSQVNKDKEIEETISKNFLIKESSSKEEPVVEQKESATQKEDVNKMSERAKKIWTWIGYIVFALFLISCVIIIACVNCH